MAEGDNSLGCVCRYDVVSWLLADAELGHHSFKMALRAVCASLPIQVHVKIKMCCAKDIDSSILTRYCTCCRP